MSKLERLGKELSKATAHRNAVAGQREQREANLTKAEADLETARRQIQTRALIPGQDSGEAGKLEARLQELEGEVDQLRNAESEAAASVRRAEHALEEETVRLTPELAARAGKADQRFLTDVAELGEGTVKGIRKALLAERKRDEAIAELQGLTAQLRGAGGIRLQQVQELRSHLRNREPVSDEVILGYLVLMAAEIARREGGLKALWQNAGIPLLEGSALEARIGIDRFALFHQRLLPPIDL